MNRFIFHDPLWFLALAALPLAMWLRTRRRVPVLLVPFAAAWYRPSLASPSRWPALLAFTGLVLVVVALARPQRVEDKRQSNSRGYDIMLCVDVSGSMQSIDYGRPDESPNRLETIKPIIQGFIDRRRQDRIGLVLFGGKAYTLAPLTFDHQWISRQMARLKIGMIDPDNTVIGDGLGTALNRLDQDKRMLNGKRLGAFIVLLTDGGESQKASGGPLSLLPPLEAATIARNKNIPIYTIGIGRDGIVWFPETFNGQVQYHRLLSHDSDPELLKQIADMTGGQFYRAEDKDTIANAFRAIDRAQKIEFQATSYLITTELFPWAAIPGLGAILAAVMAARPAWRKEVPA